MTRTEDGASFRSSRRTFLAQATVAASGLAFAPLTGCLSPSGSPAQDIIDTHTHFYDPNRAQGVPWPPRNDTLLYRPVLPPEFERLARPLGVAGTVVVEASPWEEDNQWVLDLARREPVILGLVGHLKPGQPGFQAQLKRFAANPRFRGVRTGLWDIKVQPANPDFVNDLRDLAQQGLALDLLVGPDQLSVVAELAAKVPEFIMVIDHCANVRVDGGTPPGSWTTGIRSVARQANVQMKMSGLVEGTGRTDGFAPRATEYYRPVLDVIWEAFGEERLLFGSNWPVSARFADYATVLQIARSYVEARGKRAADRVLRLNAQRVYGVPVT